MRNLKYFLLLILLIFSLYDAEANKYDIYKSQVTHNGLGQGIQNDLYNYRKNIEVLSSRIQAFHERFSKFDSGYRKHSPIPEQNTAELSLSSVPENLTDENEDLSEGTLDIKNGSTTSKIGMYFIPFVGLQYADDVRFATQVAFPTASGLPNIEIDDELGFVSGLRLGFQKDFFFLETDLTHSEVEFDTLNIPDILKPVLIIDDFHGDVEQTGLFISGGFKYNLSDYILFKIGGGIGIMKQEISGSVSFFGTSEEYNEKEIIFIYQFLAGFNFNISEKIHFGLRYRWLDVGQGEADFLSSRDAHLAELSIGYNF